MRQLKYFFLLAVISMFAACSNDDDSSSSTPVSQQIVGSWSIDSASADVNSNLHEMVNSAIENMFETNLQGKVLKLNADGSGSLAGGEISWTLSDDGKSIDISMDENLVDNLKRTKGVGGDPQVVTNPMVFNISSVDESNLVLQSSLNFTHTQERGELNLKIKASR
ncbi:hypothetical protein [Aureibacter tunicatorum]|uniref:Lipocalin-like domain-containing protein n=1 Tax=Aureibacter tunicatorum TaxID=866807 RepID=A0AAE4BPQ1_9BACT|nr:hypothetical protein [Aureibacter tunicatorum]MDR6238224.1 hypothetical protein [Aureibacter tunicatorum]BDD03257.1 hypothetical protein AUTU_07400 [Aureibacter tunicatorum]